jgi:hypothetical protein
MVNLLLNDRNDSIYFFYFSVLNATFLSGLVRPKGGQLRMLLVIEEEK